jgi:outer membrane protein TolC
MARLSIRGATIAALLLATLSGCATFSKDGGFDAVADASRSKLGQEVRWPRTAEERAKRDARVAELLAHPLGSEDAVQIALLNNHGLQAAFQELKISEADLVQAGRLPNPTFTLRHTSAAGLYDIEESLTFNVLSLVIAPYLHETEKRRFARLQNSIVVQVAQLADRTRTAYFTAVAARESLAYAWQVKAAAATGAELAQRMLSAGNWNRLDQVREQSFNVEALQDLARAKLAAATAESNLSRLLGIADEHSVQLADHLPELPGTVYVLPNLEKTALENRLDLQIRRADLDVLARRLRLGKATRFVNVLDVGPARVREGTRADPYEKGYEVSLEVPIFDSGGARVRKAEALYEQAVEDYAQAAVDARTEVRNASARANTAYELALREHEEVMKASRMVAQQDLLRYNASLVSVCELLADARAQVVAVNDYIQRLSDYWIAKSQLDTALIASSSP